MRKVYLKRAIRVVSCICIVVTFFYLSIPQQQNRVLTIEATFQDNPLDILCVGSSHMQSGLNPLQMYYDKGFSSIIVGGAAQAPWQTYFYIKEVLKKRKPKLVVMDVYTMGSRQDVDNQYMDYQTITNLRDFPASGDKICALMESKANSKLDVFLRFPCIQFQYGGLKHLTTKKFYGTPSIKFGYMYKSKSTPRYDVIDVRGVTEATPIHPKNEKYLRKIIEYLQENDVEILLVNAPWSGINVETEKYYNYIADVASEYGVELLDGCKYYEEIGIDYTCDNYDSGGHLNHGGVTKYTAWVEEYIARNYAIPDRRGDSFYDGIYAEGLEWYKGKMTSGE